MSELIGCAIEMGYPKTINQLRRSIGATTCVR